MIRLSALPSWQGQVKKCSAVIFPLLPGTTMRLAAAQSISVPGDVPANVLIHLQFIAAAQEAGVDLLVFPELSLGGYSIYRKQYLHPNEETFATSGAVGCRRHALGGESFALGICADTNHQQHAEAAAASGASLYLTSVLFSVTAYAEDAGKLRRYAQQFDMGVLMANHGGRSGAYQSAGRSAFWAPGGEPVVAAPGTGNTLVIASKGASGWRGEVLAVEVTVPGF